MKKNVVLAITALAVALGAFGLKAFASKAATECCIKGGACCVQSAACCK